MRDYSNNIAKIIFGNDDIPNFSVEWLMEKYIGISKEILKREERLKKLNRIFKNI